MNRRRQGAVTKLPISVLADRDLTRHSHSQVRPKLEPLVVHGCTTMDNSCIYKSATSGRFEMQYRKILRGTCSVDPFPLIAQITNKYCHLTLVTIWKSATEYLEPWQCDLLILVGFSTQYEGMRRLRKWK